MSSRNVLRSFRDIFLKKKYFGKYSIVWPGNVSDAQPVPDHIPKPSYYKTGIPEKSPSQPEIKNEEQIELLRTSCRLAAAALEHVGEHLKIGQTTEQIDKILHDFVISRGAYPSPLNYRNFPKSACTSVNNVACHGIPDDRPLFDGDIVNIDVTVYLNGYHGDCSKTFAVGDVDEMGLDLIKATEDCLRAGIAACGPGRQFRDIGRAIENRAHDLGYNVVPDFIGHGIGTYFHGPPDILHYSNSLPGEMIPGMSFTVEPILSQGSRIVELLDDGWTAVTEDNARTAQCEHTVLITDSSCEILTVQ